MGLEYPYELRWWWEYAILFFLRPLLAILFIFSLILLSWFVAWKTVLVHVPLVQEIFGLRKKPVKPKPPTRHRFSRFYNSNSSIRWQHASGIQRGLFPSQQGPVQIIHKSSNRCKVGKSSDEEEQKQRRLKAILNKLTPQNFDKLFSQVKAIKIDNTLTLSGVISQIIDKALMEPTFCEMYVDFCLRLASEIPDFCENNEKITFRRLLLNKCQYEFERGEREQVEANKAEEEGEIHQTKEEREEKRILARRHMLGNIRLIGELYKKNMLTERIMYECIHKLLGYYQNHDEVAIESLCKLMSTIGALIDHSKAKEYMDAYFDMMALLSTNEKLSSRVRFMLKDIIDLRKNKWQQRRKVEGPNKIKNVLKNAAQEGQAQTTTLAHSSVVSSRWGPPSKFGHWGTTILNSPSSQANTNIRGLPTQARGFGSQDIQHEVSQLYEEEQKQRRLKSILNKLRPQNFEKLFSQVKAVKIDNTLTLFGVISQIIDKALMEPIFCEMYVDFCLRLASEIPDFCENNEKITFRRLLLNKCQYEFERGEREQVEANKAEEEGEIHQTKEEREEKRILARRHMLGNIRLIGELYKKNMLTERIMHECIHKLLRYYQNPDEEDIELLCKLMSTIGVLIDHSKAKELMDAYFDMMTTLSTNKKLSSRVRFMLKDIIDLRKNKWQQRRKVEGSKKIEDVVKDAAQEGHAQTIRLACGPVVSLRCGPPSNFDHRGTTILNSPSFQANTNIRGLPIEARGLGRQDVQHEDRQLYEEEQKQRRLKAILNKLRPQNFEKLFSQVKDIKIDNTLTLYGVISQIVDKALMEPTFCEMYVDFCLRLANELPNCFENNEKITFRRLLLNKCQNEFERGEREQVEANKVEEEGEIRQTKEEREEKRIRAQKHMLGNIHLIGEMYKKKMLTESIIHECIQKLLGYYENPNEEDMESLCKLMSTIGALIDHSKAKELMDAYFERMAMLSTNEYLSSRLIFMLKDIIDLRKNKWKQRRKVEGSKKIEDVHKDDVAQKGPAQTGSVLGSNIFTTSREDSPQKYRTDRLFGASNDQINFQDHNSLFGIRDSHSVSHIIGRCSVTTTSVDRAVSSGGKVKESSEAKAFSEDALRKSQY